MSGGKQEREEEEEEVLLCVEDYKRAAKKRMTKSAYGYYEGGCEDNISLSLNPSSFSSLLILPRVMVDVSKPIISTSIFSHSLPSPVLISPTAMHRLANKEGEKATARGCVREGSIMILSQASSVSVEEVAAAMREEMEEMKKEGGSVSSSELPLWFQLYVTRDGRLNEHLVKRAEKAGCTAFVVTVDTPITGKRENNIKNKFSYPPGVEAVHFKTMWQDKKGEDSSSTLANLFDSSLNWSYLSFLRSLTSLPILIKGILNPDDAVKAVKMGVAGVIVSNHGARQLDTSAPPILCLPSIARAVKQENKDCLVFIDGGISRGRDILKCLALGADAVCIGRGILWGLAVEGREGVRNILRILKEELRDNMALSGCATLASLSSDLITTQQKLLASL